MQLLEELQEQLPEEELLEQRVEEQQVEEELQVRHFLEHQRECPKV